MTLRLHNTLTRKKEDFVPLDPARVRLYLCGPTVWSYAHIGNARPAVVFGLLSAVLRQVYGAKNVFYASNLTDIDDKIMTAAAETGEAIGDLTARFAKIYNEDMAALGAQRPDAQPRATAHVPEMIEMVKALIARGHAYAAEGHVLFHVPSMPDYGRLSGKNRDDLIAGARVDVAPYKKDPADFVLWKPSTPDQPGWDSPWGRGRPGWHLECSAMNAAINGPRFDIHAGGEDLIFPHHENEIAQSACAHGQPYVNYWVHNGHLMVEGRKMSKSLGNVLLAHDLLREYPAEALRYVLLSAHYRQPLDFTRDGVAQARNTLDRWYALLRGTHTLPARDVPAAVLDALKDDLNTPKAFAELNALARKAAEEKTDTARADFAAGARFLGLCVQDPEVWFKGSSDDAGEVENLIAALTAARAGKNYAAADALRAELKDRLGVTVSIGKDGAVAWRKE